MSTAQSPETQAQIQAWRLKATAGTLTPDEMKAAIRLLRGSRLSAAESAKASKSKKAPAKSESDLLNELENL